MIRYDYLEEEVDQVVSVLEFENDAGSFKDTIESIFGQGINLNLGTAVAVITASIILSLD